MSLLVANCPRCGANQITFDVRAQVYRSTEYDWCNLYEIFCVCRACSQPTIYVVGLSTEGYHLRDTFYKEGALVMFLVFRNNHMIHRR